MEHEEYIFDSEECLDKTQEFLLEKLKKQMREDTFIVNSIEFSKMINEYSNNIEFQTIELNADILEKIKFITNESSGNEKFANAVYTTYQKYGYELVEAAIKEFVENSIVDGFTRENDARKIVEKMTPQEVKNIIVSESQSLNYDLYLNQLLQKKALEVKSEILKKACIGTFIKYNITQVERALNEAKNGDFSFFSNCGELNLRELLIRNVNKNEVEMLMKAILIKDGIDNDNHLQTEFLRHLDSMVEV